MMNKGDRVTVFVPGDEFDGRKGFVEFVDETSDCIIVSFGGALGFAFAPEQLREGW